MNKLELKMTELLLDLKQNHHVGGIKAEFEAEGTRMEEAMRLKDVTSAIPGLGLNIKIGGCEAIKDMFDAISLGAQRIIAPMVETPYALQKFIRAAQMVYGEELDQVEILVNIETFVAYQNFEAMLAIPEIKLLNGIVIGRVDMVGSMGLARNQVNSQRVLDLSLDLAKRAKDHNLKVVVGGGVSVDSISFFQAFPANHIDRFETRKIIFNCPAAIQNSEIAFIKAVQFEIMWLKNKQNYYSVIAREDEERIQMMQERYDGSLQKLQMTAAKEIDLSLA